MKPGFIVLVLCSFLIFKTAHSQEPRWEWASFVTSQEKHTTLENISAGYHNDIYVACAYDTLLVAGDSSMLHPNMISGNNYAVIKYSSEGDFIDAVDIYTIPGSRVYEIFTAVGRKEDPTFAGSFSKRVFFLDTMINHCYTPYIDSPDGLVFQLDQNMNIKWIKTIGGTLTDQVEGLVVSEEGNIFILSDHYANNDFPCYIDFFQQDTLLADRNFISVSGLNSDGILQWRKEFYGSFSPAYLMMGKDSCLYFWGEASSDYIIIENDTIVKPGNTTVEPVFFSSLGTNGIIQHMEFVEFPVRPLELDVSMSGDICFSGNVYDSIIINGDSINVPQGTHYAFVGKFNPHYQPVWYQVIQQTAGNQLGVFDIEACGEDLAFSSYTNQDVQIVDTVFIINYGIESFTGFFDKDGNLSEVTMNETSGEFYTYELALDPCNNVLLSGQMSGKIYLYDDTVSSYSQSVFDGTLVKIRRNYPMQFNIGPDTLACKDYLLAAPAGYQEYSLNDSLISQNWCLITTSGRYIFGCSAEGCWSFDTAYIEIQPEISLNLGTDTTIFLNDSLNLTIQPLFDSIIWFNGSYSDNITIVASDYQPGVIAVWAKVFLGPCSAIDTIYLTIKNDFGTNEPDNRNFSVFPNPFNQYLTVELSKEIKSISLLNPSGILRHSIRFNSRTNKFTMDLEGLDAGIYLLKVIDYGNSVKINKVIKVP
ncbi:MAG TPA: T9SS type A sorting domain-containing protein [Bacteroidales bacterium]|nr:T9SS type A sorting domain-containing protein [Bacteroidales bacterium]HPI84955.1 T9SS type A sorting domain-containing protein [Bacteroidales bacterium]HPM00517.1 T9SS type A sorting domain-containing protein [Candidatus Cloacimonadota bacterium]